MSGIKDGLTTGIERALDEAGPFEPVTPAKQLPLLQSSAIEPGEAENGSDTPASGTARGAGRPHGSPNKRTAEIRDYLLARYPHPLQGLCEIYSRSVKDLARELGCEPLEALNAQRAAALGALPYLEAKMPQAVDVNAKGSVTLVLEGFKPDQTQAIEGGGLVIEGELADEGEND